MLQTKFYFCREMVTKKNNSLYMVLRKNQVTNFSQLYKKVDQNV